MRAPKLRLRRWYASRPPEPVSVIGCIREMGWPRFVASCVALGVLFYGIIMLGAFYEAVFGERLS